jgi:hypothetical protein
VPTTDAETARGLRDRPFGRILVLLAVLVLAVAVSRSCGATEAEVSQEEAIAIAKREVDFEPTEVVVRFLKRGLNQRGFWLVGLSREDASGEREQATNVIVDAETGAVTSVEKAIP